MNQVCIHIRSFPNQKAPDIVEDSDIPLPAVILDVPFIQCIDPKTTAEDVAKRMHLGAVNGTEFHRDLFGSVYCGDLRLSSRVWTQIDAQFYLVRPLPAALVRKEGGFSRLWRRITKKDCHHCHIFDNAEGIKWRHQETHKFDDGSTAEMWDDVLFMVGSDIGAAPIPDTHIGYCRVREAIVDGRNRVCAKFSRG